MLNQVCDPLDPCSEDEHKHKCESCGTCWKHREDAAQESDEAFDEAHRCPKCGEEQTWKLRADGTQVPQEDRDFSRLLRAFLRF